MGVDLTKYLSNTSIERQIYSNRFMWFILSSLAKSYSPKSREKAQEERKARSSIYTGIFELKYGSWEKGELMELDIHSKDEDEYLTGEEVWNFSNAQKNKTFRRKCLIKSETSDYALWSLLLYLQTREYLQTEGKLSV